jgi:hypothetical protein
MVRLRMVDGYKSAGLEATVLLYKQLIITSHDGEVTTDQLLPHIVHARWCHDLFSILQSAHPHQHLGTLLTILPHLPLSTINSDVHVN